jgi:hypothetical protein
VVFYFFKLIIDCDDKDMNLSLFSNQRTGSEAESPVEKEWIYHLGAVMGT